MIATGAFNRLAECIQGALTPMPWALVNFVDGIGPDSAPLVFLPKLESIFSPDILLKSTPPNRLEMELFWESL